MPIKRIIDHEDLKYYMITRKATKCQAHWVEFLSKFNFVISYLSDKENQKADFLTYYSNDFP